MNARQQLRMLKANARQQMLKEVENENDMSYIELLETDLEKYKKNEPDSPYIRILEKAIDRYYDSKCR